MDEPFLLPVTYKNETVGFPAQLHAFSYSYRIEVNVNDVPFHFERDDSGNFRAIAVTPDDASVSKTDPALLQAIADTLEEILA